MEELLRYSHFFQSLQVFGVFGVAGEKVLFVAVARGVSVGAGEKVLGVAGV